MMRLSSGTALAKAVKITAFWPLSCPVSRLSTACILLLGQLPRRTCDACAALVSLLLLV